MKRCVLFLFALSFVPMLSAQTSQQSGVAQPPASADVQVDGKCRQVRPGDTVHYALTIESVGNAKAVYADLQLRMGKAVYRPADLPMPGVANLGGGGVGTRDSATSNVFRFSFKVAPDVVSGVYRAAGVVVTVDHGDADARPVEAEVNKHARDEVKNFCLAVFGPGGGLPVVTDFKPGEIEHK